MENPKTMNFDIPRNVLDLPITENDLRQTPKPVIVNVVATYDLWNRGIDAEKLTLRLPGFGFDPQRFAAVKMRMNRAMTLVFCGGRAVCPGARRVSDARLSALRFTQMLLDAGEQVTFRRFRVQNIVCSCWAPFEVEIADIIREYSGNAEYKDDKFPGLQFRMNEPGTVFNIFVTGQVVITGSRDYEHSIRSWWWLYTHVLVRYRRGTAARSTSSAAYKSQMQRSRDTFASDCNHLAAKYARRENGPLARSEFGEYLRTPMSTGSRAATPFATPTMNGAGPVKSVAGNHTPGGGVIVLFQRIERIFHNHTIHCPFVRAARDGPAVAGEAEAKRFWGTVQNELECALAGAPGATLGELVDEHRKAGCVSLSVMRNTEEMDDAARCFLGQLHEAIHGPQGAGEKDGANDSGEKAVKSTESAFEFQRGRLELEDLFDAEAEHRLHAFHQWCAQDPHDAVDF